MLVDYCALDFAGGMHFIRYYKLSIYCIHAQLRLLYSLSAYLMFIVNNIKIGQNFHIILLMAMKYDYGT